MVAWSLPLKVTSTYCHTASHKATVKEMFKTIHFLKILITTIGVPSYYSPIYLVIFIFNIATIFLMI